MTTIPVSDLLDLGGRAALVTGASGTIGAGIALRLHEAGAAVLLHAGSDTTKVQRLADRLNAHRSRSAVVASGDVQRDAEAIVARGRHVFGALDILVNNAGIQPVAALPDLTSTDEEEMLRVNTGGVMAMTRCFAAALGVPGAKADTREEAEPAAATRAAVVNIASIEGLQPAAGHSHYAAAKAAILMHTRVAALELGPLGIRVNAVAPGLIDDGRLEQRWPEGVRRWHAAAPLQRLGTPQDVADAVLFLVSDAARWISGATLVVDGGVLTRSTW